MDSRLTQSLPMPPSQPEEEEPADLQNPSLKDKQRANREREKKDWISGVQQDLGEQQQQGSTGLDKALGKPWQWVRGCKWL